MRKNLNIGIDATSIVNTGGFTHLYHLIESLDKKFTRDINKIIIFSSKSVLDRLPNPSLVFKQSHFFLNKGKVFRFFFSIISFRLFFEKK